MVAAFAFGFGASLLRLAFGGHYLSDVLLGGLLALIVIEVVRRVIWPLGSSEPDSLGGPELQRSRRRDWSGRLPR
jgi:membrane-associated phospholipid phosphatase